MKKRMAGFLCALLVAGCIITLVPVQAYAVQEDTAREEQIAPQYKGIAELSANLNISNGVAYCRGTTLGYEGYTVRLVMVLKRNNVEFQKWECTVSDGSTVLYKPCNITRGHIYQVVVTAYVYNSAGVLVESPSASTGIKTY